MKEFNLEAAKAGAKVQTRDGRPARIVCYDMKGQRQPILVLITERGEEFKSEHSLDGRYYIKSRDDRSDLFMAPIKKTGWINIYPDGTTGRTHTTQNKALEYAGSDRIDCIDHIDTIKIEWEE